MTNSGSLIDSREPLQGDRKMSELKSVERLAVVGTEIHIKPELCGEEHD
jgi:hypothetical protein